VNPLARLFLRHARTGLISSTVRDSLEPTILLSGFSWHVTSDEVVSGLHLLEVLLFLEAE